MTVPSEKMLHTLAARYGVPIVGSREELDKSVKKAAAAWRKQRRQSPMQDRDYVTIMRILARQYSITSREFASATRMAKRDAQAYLQRLECEGVLVIMHRTNRYYHYTLRTP
jgi:hypothetical protein